jgi:hypothetical protein
MKLAAPMARKVVLAGTVRDGVAPMAVQSDVTRIEIYIGVA